MKMVTQEHLQDAVDRGYYGYIFKFEELNEDQLNFIVQHMQSEYLNIVLMARQWSCIPQYVVDYISNTDVYADLMEEVAYRESIK